MDHSVEDGAGPQGRDDRGTPADEPPRPANARNGHAGCVVAAVAGLAVPVTLLGLLAFDLYRSCWLDYAVIQASLRGNAVTEKLHGDGRFVSVTSRIDSSDESTLVLRGSVASPDDLAVLRQIVQSTGPDVPLRWDVSVGPVPAPATGTARVKPK